MTSRRDVLKGAAACAATLALPIEIAGDEAFVDTIERPSTWGRPMPMRPMNWSSSLYYHKPKGPCIIRQFAHQDWEWYGVLKGDPEPTRRYQSLQTHVMQV